MAFDWTENKGREDAPRLDVGKDHQVEITKVIYGNKSGPFKSNAGDPRIMLIMADADGSGCATMLTLSHKAGWVIKSILEAAGANLVKMKEKGIEPQDFADEEFGNTQLVGRKLSIRIKGYVSAGGNLAEIVAIPPRPADEPQLPPGEDIPF